MTGVYAGLDVGTDETGPLPLNYYQPDGKGPHPLVVYVFGGAWRAGDRHQFDTSLIARLPDHGYAAASITYRHSQAAHFPAQILDVKRAIGWLRRHARQMDIDEQRIAVFGPSAGGHLAALAGTTGSNGAFVPQGYEPADCVVHAVVDFFGPSDFLHMDAHSISDAIIHDDADSPESALIGAPIQSRPDLTRLANPITYIDGNEPPFLIVHGDLDPLVPHHQSELLFAALQNAGADARLRTVVGGGHGDGGAFGEATLRNEVLEFLATRLVADQ